MLGKLKLIWYLLQILLLVRALMKQRHTFNSGKNSFGKVANLLITLWFVVRKVRLRVR